jgi:hypothetical protein
MRTIWLAAGGIFMAMGAQAQSIGAPKVDENDSWTYQHTVEIGTNWQQTHVAFTVTRAGPTAIASDSTQVGSTIPPREQLTGPDWSRRRSVNGRETVVNEPMAFPLSIGKSWQIDYTEAHPNRQHSSEHFQTPYKVTGWEDVTVPAGTFHALKIEADGQWSAVIAPAIGTASGTRVDAQGATTVMQSGRTGGAVISGRTYKAFWYVPSVKRWVKSVEEYYNTNDTRTSRYTDQLESYKVSN